MDRVFNAYLRTPKLPGFRPILVRKDLAPDNKPGENKNDQHDHRNERHEQRHTAFKARIELFLRWLVFRY